MTTPVLEGWFTDDAERPQLLGSRCAACGSVYFPKLKAAYCRNPDCEGSEFDELPLSRTGTLWSFTNACYAPPLPYVAADPHQPFAIAAVELAAEKMVVLGPVIKGVEVGDLSLGMTMDLVLEPLEDGRMTWKWRPLTEVAGD